MKNRLLHTALVLVVTCAGLLGMGMTAYANECTHGWTATYTGKEVLSDFNQGTVNEKLSELMPGDSITLNVNYANASSKTADFYMASQILATLEDNSEAIGGAYSYAISYNAGAGENYIYDSETIGGENTTVKGLMQVASDKNNFFYVGKIAPGSQGTVTIKISLDGNSQNNDYMSTLAQLGIKFAVEETSNITRSVVTTIPGSGTNRVLTNQGAAEIISIQGNDVTVYRTGSPQTGDSLLPLVICAVAVILGILLILYYFFLLKKQDEEKEVA